jgi:membrane-associated protein
VIAVQHFLDLFLHIDAQLAGAVSTYGAYIYALLFVVIFCETGFVVTPFLPGDSLLFAAGALASAGSLHIWWLLGIFATAAILGDTTNYVIGREFGHRIIASGRVRILKPEYICRTQAFFERHGGKTIMLARFFPIIRTVAPFMAGVGDMSLPRFWAFNISGGSAWVTVFAGAGYLFGNIPIVKHNLTLGILVMIAISFIPSIYQVMHARTASRRAAAAAAAAAADPPAGAGSPDACTAPHRDDQ